MIKIRNAIPLALYSNTKVLELLREEREKFTKSDREYMQKLCDCLVKRGVYPEYGCPDTYKYPALQMVEGWGVDWHEFSQPHFCRHCGTDLRDHSAGTPFKREIYMKDLYNLYPPYHMCPDCKGRL